MTHQRIESFYVRLVASREMKNSNYKPAAKVLGCMASLCLFIFGAQLQVNAQDLYASFFARAVVRYDSFGVPTTVQENAPGLFNASGMAFDGQGNLFVASASNVFGSRILRISASDGTISEFAPLPGQPVGLAMSSTGDLFVSIDGAQGRILRLTPSGTSSLFALTSANPAGLAFDSGGNLFVSHYGSGSIDRFTMDGVGTTFATGFVRPYGIAFDGEDNLYVANNLPDINGENLIQRITPAGMQSVFANNSAGLDDPFGLVFDGAGNLFVANGNNILRIAPNGVSSVFSGPSPFGSPQYLAISPFAVPEPSTALSGVLVIGVVARSLWRRNSRPV